MLRLQAKFLAVFTGFKFLTSLFALAFVRAFYPQAALLTAPPCGPGTKAQAWPAQPAVADQPRYNGKRSDAIRPTPSPVPPWTGQAVGGSSRTFSRPFSDSTPNKLLCPNVLHDTATLVPQKITRRENWRAILRARKLLNRRLRVYLRASLEIIASQQSVSKPFLKHSISKSFRSGCLSLRLPSATAEVEDD